MTSAEPQGWYEDPFRLHQARYFSAGQPTKLVRDGNVESYDEPPQDGGYGSGGAASAGHAVSGTLVRAEANAANGPNRSGDDVPASARRRPRAGVYAAVAVVAIAGVVIAAVIVGKPRPASGPATEAMAYTATMNASSADVYTTSAFTSGNRKVDTTVTESGPVSWSADQGETAMTTTLDGGQFMTGQQIFDGTKIYSKFSIKGVPAGALSTVPGVAGWTEATWTGTSSPDESGFLPTLFFGSLSNPAETTNPASLLELLHAQASTVQNLGGEVIDGTSTTHYRALIPLSRLGVGTPAEELQLQQIFGASSIGVDYWIDSAHLLRKLSLVLTVLRPASTTTSSPGEVSAPLSYPITFSISLQLSHYGTPVHVVPPPPAQITSRETCVTSGDGFSCDS